MSALNSVAAAQVGNLNASGGWRGIAVNQSEPGSVGAIVQAWGGSRSTAEANGSPAFWSSSQATKAKLPYAAVLRTHSKSLNVPPAEGMVTIGGRLRDSVTGEPIKGLVVISRVPDKNDSASNRALMNANQAIITDARGAFTVRNIPRGVRVSILAVCEGYRHEKSTVRTRSTDPSRIDLVPVRMSAALGTLSTR